MIIKADTLQALRTMVRGEFQARMAQLGPKEDYKKLVTIVPSTTAQNTYAWMGKFPKLRKWIGARVVKSMSEHGYAITNEKFESTLGIDRTDIEDDNLGVYRPLAQAEADAVVDFFNLEVFNLLKNGFAALCYDGQNFFDTDHPIYPNEDGTGVAVATSNIITPAAAGTPWYLVNLEGVLRPFILQQRSAPEFDELTDPKSDSVFTNDQFQFGIRYRGSFGYGFWQQAVASKDTLNAANFVSAKNRMAGFTADGGAPLGIRPTHLVVPQSLEATAKELLKQNLAGGESNIHYNAVELIVSPWL